MWCLMGTGLHHDFFVPNAYGEVKGPNMARGGE